MLYNDFSILDNLGRLFSQKKKTPRIDYFSQKTIRTHSEDVLISK
jgi:hypothetical protein